MPVTRLLDVLTCPHCGERLVVADGSLRCSARHSFDIARQGYVGLLTGNMKAGTADSADMVRARTAFLGAGHYDPLAAALARVVGPLGGETVLDAGAGTGHYLAAVLDALPGAVGLGLDASKYALRQAARCHPRAWAATWDVWRPFPVRTGSVDVVLNVFAPRNGEEFHRVLRPGRGALVVVTPTPAHLAELRGPLGLLGVDSAKEDRLERTLGGRFRAEGRYVHEHTVDLAAEDVEHLVLMGPSARHIAPEELRERVGALQLPVRTTVSCTVSVHRPV
ncbi:methyltransferase domain-containing protein [Streptomyces thioluteus]|uniref:Methyltransferase domain-containing protein n=1 Tax=Streptomyces thioluteus TaxID=66431 RepID=A0ABN3WE36_STRTU